MLSSRCRVQYKVCRSVQYLCFSNNICILKGAPCVSNTCATSGMSPPSSDGAATDWTAISGHFVMIRTFPNIFPCQAPAQRGGRRRQRRLLQAPRQEEHQVWNLSQEKVTWSIVLSKYSLTR